MASTENPIRYVTVGGATVELALSTTGPDDSKWTCTGCGVERFFVVTYTARSEANEHASTCRALPNG